MSKMSLARTAFSNSTQLFSSASRAVYPGYVQSCNRRVWLNFLRRKIENEDPKPLEHESQSVVQFDNYTKDNLKKRTSIQTQRAYTPPENLEETVLQIVRRVYGKGVDWREIDLDQDRRTKFTVLTRMMKEFDHYIPNTELHDMKTIDQAVEFFKKEVRDTTCLEDLTKLDLPKNLHINTEYIRYNRDEDSLWPGKDAFPGRQTRVFSTKFSKKYKVVDKSKDKYRYNFNRKTIFEEQKEYVNRIEKASFGR
ncbi:uncharacterized protein LOC125672166 isoform X2 [Ostrea edulis]|uniref:uncharacterized protein LOC125672166 isoform X2 n=1 Tax=Ostrea edulis TaxID=37623 RepID=UPI0024AEFDB9|nr:uncharacterized protein LOC125672166 isoform X2 [Ostrea edulis]